jgi:hypothetical protein
LATEIETADKIERLKRMIICHADLQTSLSAITFLNEEASEDEIYHYVELRRLKCYETAFVIAYGRAFTKNHGSKHTKLSLKKIGLQLSKEETAIHDRIISARSKKYAHSDLASAHTRIDAHMIDVKFKDFPIYPIQFHHIQWDEGLNFIGGLEPYAIMDLIRKIIAHLGRATQDLVDELKDHLPIYINPE